MKASNFAVQAEADWILPSLKSLLLVSIEAFVLAVAPVLGVRQFDHGRITLQKAAEAIEGSEGRKGPLKSFL